MTDQSRWPDFLIVGAPRAGTTTLHDTLATLEGVAMSRVKEPRFFSRVVDKAAFFSGAIADGHEYRALWKEAQPKDRLGESTPIYFHDPGSPRAVAEVIPEAKIVVSLRDPVRRAVSHYWYHERRTGRSTITLKESLANSMRGSVSDYHSTYLTEPGYYARNLRAWFEFFPRDQVHVIYLEDLRENPTAVMRGLGEFLDLRQMEVSRIDRQSNRAATPKNASAARIMRSRSIRRVVRTLGLERIAVQVAEKLLTTNEMEMDVGDPDSLRALAQLYQEDDSDLRTLLGVDPPWDLSVYR